MPRVVRTTRRRAWAALAGCLAAMALSPDAVADPVPAEGEPVLAPAVTAGRRIALWNHDVELGSNDAAPTDWRPSPATPGPVLSAVRVPAPAAFPRYTGEQTVNHVMWVRDRTRRTGMAARMRPVEATPGRTYAAHAQVLLGAGTSARLALEFLNPTGRRVGLVYQQTRPPAAGALKWVMAAGVAPAGTTSVRPLVYSSYAAIGSSYWDLVYLDEVAAPPAYAAGLGTGPVLFVGSERVEQTAGLTRVVHPGEKYRAAGDPRVATPVLDPVCCMRNGQPAHTAQLYGTVLHEDGVYKMWYTAKAAGVPWSVRYAESADGRSFPAGLQVLSDVWAGGVVRNPDTTDPSRRYLMLGVKGTMPGVTTVPMPPVDVTYRAYASPDGLEWTPLSADPVLPMRDVAYVTYDEVGRRFVATTKQASGSSDRRAYVSYSTDFVRWTAPRQALAVDGGDPAASGVYGAAVFRYGDQFLGVPLVYTKAVVNGVDGPIVPQIASSADGLRWSRLARTPVVPLGAAGELDDGMILTASAPVVDGDRVRLYYGAWDAGHEMSGRSARIFYAEWRRDGFVSLRAAAGTGTLTTRALRPTGDDLTVNADLGAGQLRAEVLDAATNSVVAGYGSADSSVVTGDTLAGSLTWGGKTVDDLGARQIKLRFTITAGDLYSFRIS